MVTEQISIIGTVEIEQLLDATRERYGLTSDEKLAHLLGVSDQAIYRWRRGQIDKSARILATLAREHAAPALS
jgi:transcriptional regulator with XRE-family HTH domain